jgi:YidC/Oxa1 family membrane protein insertase
MQPRNRLATVYLTAAIILLVGVWLLQGYLWPPPKPPRKATDPETVGMYAGAMATAGMDTDVDVFAKAKAEREAQYPSVVGTMASAAVPVSQEAGIFAAVEAERQEALARTAEPVELIPMGWPETGREKPFHLQLLLNTQGGAIQQMILTDFQQADREGLAVVNPDGTPHPLHLIPGVNVPRTPKMRDQRNVPVPELKPGKVTLKRGQLADASYVMYHYEKENDPRPVDTLATRQWTVVRKESTADADVVAFETELGAPYYLKITKTYTLSRSDYHVGFEVKLTPTNRPPGAKVEPFRYQIDGPRNMPIEGEWYTTTYRQGVVGWQGARALEMPQTVRFQEGSDRHVAKDGRPIKYAGVMLQYFASVLALDNVQPDGQNPDYIEYVRFTPEGPTHADPARKIDQTFLDDLTFRAISKKLEITGEVKHPYVLYQGPVKVRLLKQLDGDQAVPEETVNRYRDDLNLSTLTDSPSPTWLGRFASFIFWSDIVIAFTNLIHSLIGLMTHLIPNVGICILLITIMVRGALHPLTRRQAINGKIMQAKQARLAPEVKKLTEKFGDDFTRLNQAKMQLYRDHGINPAAAMGGCLPLLLQMPIFMGLYFALQESVFFRLEPATPWWIHNLAAPDMLVWWTENIPWISAPESLGGTLFLGPYFNLLPIIAVSLMMYTQSKMMPKSDDPQVQMQQKTMKIMMILMLFFFYKVAAGLAIYFIASSIWGMIERRLLPKDIEKLEAERAAAAARKAEARGERGEPTGWLGKKMAGFKEKWDQILEEAQKQQQAQRDQRPQAPKGPTPNGPPGPPGPGKKKKKKR